MRKVLSPLAMSAADHKAVGSTPPAILLANPDKKLHETIDQQALRIYMLENFAVVLAQYDCALGGDPHEELNLRRAREQFVRDLVYLRAIGRLPEELKDLDPKTVFQLPKP
jgi:hypothetical protein